MHERVLLREDRVIKNLFKRAKKKLNGRGIRKVAFEVGDLVILSTESRRKNNKDEIGVVVKVHRAFKESNRHTFYWVKWNSNRPYIHFAHELIIIQRAKEKSNERNQV